MRGTFTAAVALVMLVAGCGGAGTAGPDGGPGDAGTPVDAMRPDAGQADASPVGDAEPPGEAGPPVGTNVTTDSGPVMGEDDGDLVVFRGIPYAAPPVGPLRFAPPAPPTPWTAPLDATAFGPVCPQTTSTGTIIGDEDCLTLNVWAHADAARHPVMVFIHGGAFIQGTGSDPLYEGSSLARAGNVVVVTLNYRLGALGLLATPALTAASSDGSAGNYGIRDQIAALTWVQHNIAVFGGDPSQVTIFGESAGGVSVCALLGSPLTGGLFERAIIESGGGCYGLPHPTTGAGFYSSAYDIGAMIVDAAGCGTASDPIACLRALPASALVTAQASIGPRVLGLPELGPNIDGVVLTDDTRTLFADGTARDVPVIIGSNADEATIFTASLSIPDEATYDTLVRSTFGTTLGDQLLAIYPVSDFSTPKAAYNHLVSDVGFICPALSFAAAASGGSAPSYAYHFVHHLSGAAALLGVFHGLELPFVFGNLMTTAYVADAADHRVSDDMQTAWTSFAKGQPPMTTPPWPAYDPTSPGILLIDDPPSVVGQIRSGRCAMLQSLGVVP